MSTYRGYDKHLISRATRAMGDRHYFDEDTLRYFDAYGCKWLDNGPDHVVMVESIRDTWSGAPHEYRVIEVKFHREVDASGAEREHVTVNRPSDNCPTARQAIAAYRTTKEG